MDPDLAPRELFNVIIGAPADHLTNADVDDLSAASTSELTAGKAEHDDRRGIAAGHHA
ncbi:hypothetical protein [Nonomuraea sp. NPDC049709]|uniref:hypothetical protein n=1 Tax=Nonomuraea sp. NPDC049709 TaxID=3154736 RepID=UPI00344A01B9